MNFKDLAYHYTNPKKIKSIFENGLIPSIGLHTTGVYMTFNLKQYLGWEQENRQALLGIHLRGLEKSLILFPEKKWIISTERIPIENIFLISDNLNNKYDISINELITTKKLNFIKNNSRCQYKIRDDLIKIM